MFPLDYFLVIALITSPNLKEEIVLEDMPYLFSLSNLFKEYCITNEYMDVREKNYMFLVNSDNQTKDELVVSFMNDLFLMRKRYKELKDAPPVHDHVRFYDHQTIAEMLNFNKRYREYLVDQISLYGQSTYRSERYTQALEETDRLYNIWDKVRDSKLDWYYITIRRAALKEVRDIVGYTAFYNGTMPPHVPVWRFSKID